LTQANRIGRRQFLAAAVAIGASSAWAASEANQSKRLPRERRDLYPEGVASGDPDAHSVLLWTRRPFEAGLQHALTVEVSEDAAFTRVVATASAKVLAAADWTCRVLVGNLRPASVYWYRFVDEAGYSSRIGRTSTAPTDDDHRAIRFAFCSCQNINMGVQSAYRRMIYEDERAPTSEQLAFVLHLGDFIYEVVWYPEDHPQPLWGRSLREVVRYRSGEKIGDVHIPTTLADYRAVYQAYLHDPDLQDARARWPFVCIWDNHEFSQSGWQSMQRFEGRNRPAQTRKVSANQAWFEYLPARVTRNNGALLERFDAPPVHDASIERFDEHGFGIERNNDAAIASLKAYRSLRWGAHVELVITDQRSYRSEPPLDRLEAQAFRSADFPQLVPEEALEILDAGRAHAGGKPPTTIRYGDRQIPNYRQDGPPQTLLGAEQKQWFLTALRNSRATWKIWSSSQATLDYRADPQNLPGNSSKPWPGIGYAGFGLADYGTAFRERAELYAFVRDQKITGFATVCGDRHSFWAGLAAPSLPPQPFEPVGVAFVTGSISTPGLVEILEQDLPGDHPLRALYLGRRLPDGTSEPTVNMLVRHGVRACLEYRRSGDLERARSLSNPDLSPHLSFVDLGGQGYATVRAAGDALECEFVCIHRPTERATRPDGAPLRYRVAHRAPLWQAGQKPHLEQRILEGNSLFSV
jgi:alkaline phosphatase D